MLTFVKEPETIFFALDSLGTKGTRRESVAVDGSGRCTSGDRRMTVLVDYIEGEIARRQHLLASCTDDVTAELHRREIERLIKMLDDLTGGGASHPHRF
jgi:hypothetical protein